MCVCLSLQAEPSPCSGVPELVLVAHSTPSCRTCKLTCLGSPVAGLQGTECCGHSVSMWEKVGWDCGRKGKVSNLVNGLACPEVQNRLHKREMGSRTASLQYLSQSIPFQFCAVSVYLS